MKSKKPETDQLASWLQAGDPAGHEAPLTAEETALLRRNIRQAAVERRPSRFGRPLIWAVAAAAMGLLALLISLTRPPVETDPPLVLAEAGQPSSRQIQFETPGGTRIIWVLKKDAASFPD